jgi:hypothetical protein
MELDDLKLAWKTLDGRLERHAELVLQMFREGRAARLRSSLRPLAIGQGLQVLVGIALAVCAAGFWIAHRDTLHWLASGVQLHLYGLLLIVLGARELALVRAIDYAAPVVGLQGQLAALRAWHLRCQLILVVVGCFIWIPFVLVVFKALFGVDVWHDAPAVVWVLVGSGFTGLLLFAGLLRLAAWKPAIGQRVQAEAIGSSLRRAQAELDEIARYVQD